MQEKEMIERIKFLCEARSWTVYRLAKESGITYSTLCTMLHKANAPSFSTLTKICSGFHITLAEFFDPDNEAASLTEEEKKHLSRWNRLSDNYQIVVQKYMDFLLATQDENIPLPPRAPYIKAKSDAKE